jgi:uncharacterized protein (DUF1501 family)
VFNQGALTRPLIANDSRTRIDQLLIINRDFNPDNPLAQIVALDTDPGGPTLIRASGQIMQDSLDIRGQLATAGDPTLNTIFPGTGLGPQLKQVAKLIKTSRDFLTGVQRQIFFVSMGGFDTHTNQGIETGTQANLWVQVSQAMTAFYQATVELGLSGQVTQFTLSDFSRTLKPGNPGANVGSDHAWGSHYFVIGDAVDHSDFYGPFPDLMVGGGTDYDAGSGSRGRWIPTQSVDQYAYTLANWYGLQGSDIPNVFPNLYRWAGSENLGFMQAPTGVIQGTNAGTKNSGSFLQRLLRL